MTLKIKNLSPALALVTALVFSAGCGTLMNGTQHHLAITSTPPGAKVTVDNREFFDTPITAVLDKSAKHTVKIELEGYLPYEMEISRKLNWSVAGGELVLFAPMLVVDVITGGIYTLSPRQVRAQLEKEDIGLIEQGDRLCISVVLEPAADMKRIGILSRTSVRPADGTSQSKM